MLKHYDQNKKYEAIHKKPFPMFELFIFCLLRSQFDLITKFNILEFGNKYSIIIAVFIG